MNNIYILAQASGDQASSGVTSELVTEEQTTSTAVASDPNAAAARERTPKSTMPTVIMFGLMFVVMYFLLFRGPRKKQQQHKQMVQSLEKNDRVRTIGGIIGTIVDINDDEVTLKVDESNNTKIKVATSAIGRNTSKDKS